MILDSPLGYLGPGLGVPHFTFSGTKESFLLLLSSSDSDSLLAISGYIGHALAWTPFTYRGAKESFLLLLSSSDSDSLLAHVPY